jgi:hypothetical protein
MSQATNENRRIINTVYSRDHKCIYTHSKRWWSRSQVPGKIAEARNTKKKKYKQNKTRWQEEATAIFWESCDFLFTLGAAHQDWSWLQVHFFLLFIYIFLFWRMHCSASPHHDWPASRTESGLGMLARSMAPAAFSDVTSEPDFEPLQPNHQSPTGRG